MTRIFSITLSFLLLAGNVVAQLTQKAEQQAARVASAQSSLQQALVLIKPIANSLARQEDKARISGEVLTLLKSADHDMVYWGIGQPAHPAKSAIQLAIKETPSSTDRIINKEWTWDTLKTRGFMEKAIKELEPSKAQPK